MPVDMSRYPKTWREISQRIRDRAGNCCEQCGAPNHAWVYRQPSGRWALMDDVDALNSDVARWQGWDAEGVKEVRIVLTVHHIGIDREDGSPGDRHDKHDCRDANLAALCQRCHLAADLDIRIANAAATRRRRRVASGQTEMELAP